MTSGRQMGSFETWVFLVKMNSIGEKSLQNFEDIIEVERISQYEAQGKV